VSLSTLRRVLVLNRSQHVVAAGRPVSVLLVLKAGLSRATDCFIGSSDWTTVLEAHLPWGFVHAPWMTCLARPEEDRGFWLQNTTIARLAGSSPSAHETSIPSD